MRNVDKKEFLYGANGLELYKIKSRAEEMVIKKLEEGIFVFNSQGFFVAYLDYKVLIGKVNKHILKCYDDEVFDEKYIQKIRLFNEESELLIWRDGTAFKGRLRLDIEGDESYVVDSYQVLWGTEKQNLGNGWIRLYEKRGTCIIVPYDDIKIDNKRNRLFLKTRNYIGFHDATNQATYIDCRFVGFSHKAG